ncbi:MULTISPECIES: DUF1090 domain-containing protein [unclassified Serratia (in: enterobacteria)]|uniref:DUF1090 domain-containing protein n=1 Tax=unclassified Serratia (in: enterobacteria) TaxID=2647522 RepID=UPI002ED40329|nr:DUF1090 domain-containing protein [Serratia sp. C2(2)]MEE4449848.1 DUF1090 domain-containing protein [Serratia sp. C2(1)]
MKISRLPLLIPLIVPFLSLQASASPTGCEAKKSAIHSQLEQARTHGNGPQVAGLEKALAEVNQHCTESGLLNEQQKKVREKEHKVAQRQLELDEANATGRQDKILKRQEKLNEANAELTEARRALGH